MKDSSA